jgi:undecaprenyl diphosphate synthase
MQRTSLLHVAVIMDGNGRWATARRLPRTAGHRAGARAVRRVVEAACAENIAALTLYAFSSDNWRRPADEVETLMLLFARYLRSEVSQLVENQVRLEVIGRRDRLPAALRSAIVDAERETRESARLQLRIAVDYSSRDAISSGTVLPDVDLLVRTGGEQRLSDFLLWECAYAELYFTSVMWPDFSASDLRSAIDAFHSRQRRFGGLPAHAS